jgi:hypothetical protein
MESEMLLASDFDKSKYFRGTDLDREKKFRIRDVTWDELTDKKGNKEKKLIVWFTNDERGLPLNKTNNRTLRGAFGDDTAGWKNKVIAIFPILASNNEKGLRIHILPPKQAPATAEPPQESVKSGSGAAAPTSGNGAATAPPVAAAPPAAPAAVHDPELEPDPVKPIKEELDDDIPW